MGTAEATGKLWGHRAEDRAELQEQTALPLYSHLIDAFEVFQWPTRNVEKDQGHPACLAVSKEDKKPNDLSGVGGTRTRGLRA